jgi:subtilisin family serine protease
LKNFIFPTLACLFALAALTQAVPLPASNEYLPNEIIIKFSENAASAAEQQLRAKIPASNLKLSKALDKLNKKYRIRKITPVIKNFRANQKRLNALKTKKTSLLTEKEKRILRRLARTPKSTKLPDLDRIYKIQLDLKMQQLLRETLEDYQNNPDVEYAELNYIVSICKTPDDPLYPLQWPLNNIGQYYPDSGRFNPPPGTPDSDIDAPQAWDINTGTSDVIVAVIDTGVDYAHRDIDDNMWTNEVELNGIVGVDDDGNGYIDDIYGYDFINEDPDPQDDHGHGTHCAGIIAAEGNNNLDITGVSWNAKIMALKFLGPDGWGSIAKAVEAIYYATQNDADVLSNNWGSGFPSEMVEEAINYAYGQGVLVIAAAGNDGSNWPFYPAYYENAIAVAATDSNDDKASFSNYGDWVDIAAPGVDVLSLRAYDTSLGTTYDSFTTILSGTSMACPHIAGASALLISMFPETQNDQLKQAMMDSTDPIEPGICASGRLNLYTTMLRLLGPKGTAWLENDSYSCADLIQIKLYDSDLDPHETQQIILSTDAGDFETVLLNEFDSAFGSFTGAIPTDSSPPITEDGILQVLHEQIVTATYYDADDGTGNPAVSADIAQADCQPPVIFNVDIDVPGPEPTVIFETDELTTARVLYSQTCPDSNCDIATDAVLTTIHTIKLTGVLPTTDYCFIIEANDIVGNQSVDDNTGRCYSFTTDGPDNIYVPSQYPTIQQAIDRSWNTGIVLVADGTYTDHGNRDIDFKGKPITVKSENGPENCAIDCNATEIEPHRGFDFHSEEDTNSILDGFTIKNGYAAGRSSEYSGGAIRCNNSSPAIKNCLFNNNYAQWDGGAIHDFNSSPIISNCIFINNSAIGNDGGAINNDLSNPVIKNCTFTANSAFDWGGAVRSIIYSCPIINNCIFNANKADDGGALFCFNTSNATITNSTFAENSARNGNTLGTESWEEPSSIYFSNCIIADDANQIWNNDDSDISIDYSNIQGGWPGIGNIDADPCFVNPGYWADINDPNIPVEPDDPNAFWIDGDYHLLETSPCIDTGDPNYTTEPNETDLDGKPRIINDRIEMGAYEFAPPVTAQMKITPQLINCSSSGKWLKAHFALPEGFSPEDVDLNTPAVTEPFGIESEYIEVFENGKGRFNVQIYFDRQAFCQNLSDYDGRYLEITVTGSFLDTRQYKGTDTIRFISRYLRHRYLRHRRQR